MGSNKKHRKLVNSQLFWQRVGHWFYNCKRPSKAVKVGRKALTIGIKAWKLVKNSEMVFLQLFTIFTNLYSFYSIFYQLLQL
jgi:hypothetical protein